jgi:tetratricopeptide (TPR) repeat protein
VLDNLGQALVRSGDRKNAEQRTRQGLKIRETLVADFPGEAGYLDSLALSKRHLGDILASRGATAEARGLLEQGVELGQKAVKADPRVREAQLHLRGSRKSLARYLVDQGAYADAAVMIDGVVGDELPENRYGTLVEAALNLEECACLALVDAKQSRERREAAALTYARRSIELLKKAAENDASNKESSVATMYLAWLRMASSVAEMRDPREALRLGRELTGRLPKRGDSWTILGAASYHCGDYQAALSAFQKAHEVDSAKFGFWDYYVAMVHFELGDVLEALASYARAEGWMKANPHAKRHERVAAHAARVLKLSEPGPASGQGRGVPAAAKGT